MRNVVSETAATPIHARREVANYGVVCLSVCRTPIFHQTVKRFPTDNRRKYSATFHALVFGHVEISCPIHTMHHPLCCEMSGSCPSTRPWFAFACNNSYDATVLNKLMKQNLLFN